MINDSEIYFFNLIKKHCSIVFDIGCRDDVIYSELGGETIQYHLFEPNPEFYAACKRKAGKYTTTVINNFGISDKTGSFTYYPNAQSFFDRPQHFIDQSTTLLNLVSFTDYISTSNIKFVDFIKIDTEGCESDILISAKEFILSFVKFVQFEYASTWIDRNSDLYLDDIICIFGEKFDFFFLKDTNHPISKIHTKVFTKIDDIGIIDEYMRKQYGFNIVMVRKDYANLCNKS